MLRNIFHWIISAVAIVMAAYLVPGVAVTWTSAFVLVIVLAFINIFIKPVIKLLTLPINILTLGIFSLVLNAAFIILVSKFVPGFSVVGFWAAFWFSIVLSCINAVFGLFHHSD